MTTAQLAQWCRWQLREFGLESADFEAGQIAGHVLDCSRQQLVLNGAKPVTEEQAEAARLLVRRRIGGEPLQYLLGNWDFFGLSFRVGPGVLIPRPETELLCEKAIGFLRQKQPGAVCYDLCAGSGCLSVALSKNVSGLQCYGVELYDGAMIYFKENIARHSAGVVPVQADVLAGPDASLPKADLILSNPPYIPKGELSSLQTEVRQEPQSALDGGEDGLDFYRAICGKWLSRLKSGGAVFFEVGIGQSQAVAALALRAGMAETRVLKDYEGIERVVCAFQGSAV